MLCDGNSWVLVDSPHKGRILGRASWRLHEIMYRNFPGEDAAVDNEWVEGVSVDSSGMEQLSSSEKVFGSRIKGHEMPVHKWILLKPESNQDANFVVTGGHSDNTSALCWHSLFRVGSNKVSLHVTRKHNKPLGRINFWFTPYARKTALLYGSG